MRLASPGPDSIRTKKTKGIELTWHKETINNQQHPNLYLQVTWENYNLAKKQEGEQQLKNLGKSFKIKGNQDLEDIYRYRKKNLKFKNKITPLSQLDVYDEDEYDRHQMTLAGKQHYEELDYMLSADFHSSYQQPSLEKIELEPRVFTGDHCNH